MGYLYRPTEKVKDAQGKVVLGPDGKPKRKFKTLIWYMKYYDVNGKQQDESSKTKIKGKAEKLLTLREAAKINRELPPPARKGTTWNQGVELIIDNYTQEKQDVPTLKKRLKHLTPYFEGYRLDQITHDDTENYRTKRMRDEKAALGTANRELAALRRILSIALERGKIQRRPMVKTPKEKNARKGFYERDQFNALRAAVPDYLKNLLTAAYYTGWRIRSELHTLPLERLNTLTKSLRLEPNEAKNDEGRTFFYIGMPEMEAAIDAQLAMNKATAKRESVIITHLFPDPDGRQIRASNYYEDLNVAFKALGWKRIPHDFRRTAVRNLVRSGVSKVVAKEMTGHKTDAVFDNYDITDERDLQEAAKKYGAYSQKVKKQTRSPKVRPFKKRNAA